MTKKGIENSEFSDHFFPNGKKGTIGGFLITMVAVVAIVGMFLLFIAAK